MNICNTSPSSSLNLVKLLWLFPLTLLLICLPSISFAETLFNPPATDKSLEYLGMIFGQIGTLPVSGGDATLSVLMRLINQIVLSLGFIIIGWTVAVSSMHSAQEGEVMGKKWSSIWVPTRAVIGMYLLLPTASGYSYIQVVVMWFILQSIGAADNLWNQVLNSWTEGGAINKPAPSVQLSGAKGAVFTFFNSKLCETVLNNHQDEYELNEPISFFQKNSDPTKAVWGYENYQTNVCGELDMTPILESIQLRSPTPLTATQKSQALKGYFHALDSVQMTLSSAATEAVKLPKESWGNYLSLLNAQLELKIGISATLEGEISQFITTTSSTTADTTVAKEAGWIHAGGFYFNLINGESKSGVSNLTFSAPSSNMQALCLEKAAFCPALLSTITNTFTQYLAYLNTEYSKNNINSDQTGIAGFTNNLSNIPPAGADSLTLISNELKKEVAKFIKDLTGDGKTDPLLALSQMGKYIMQTSEILVWTCVGVLLILAALTSFMKSMSSAGYIVDIFIIMPITLLLFFIVLLWGAGVTLGMYLPMIPYLLFLFGGLAWLIIVIETLIASPLIALTLIVPSEDEIGKATAAIVIIVGLFFRPTLMIIGFVFASKLLMVAVGMLNYGFVNVLNTTILGIGVFGAIAIIVIYAGVLTAIVHEAFSLIYVLPEKALRWMGATGENVDIVGNLKKIEGSADTGAKTSGGLAKGATSAGMKLVDMAKK